MKRKREWLVPAVLIAAILVSLGLFYRDYTRTVDIGDRKVVGYITFKNNIVQRRLFDQVVWSNLANNSPLTNRDTIRSENFSDAVIHLDDGTIIKIDENSMFFLDLSGSEPQINFTGGAIQVEQAEGSESTLTINTGDRTIEVSGSQLKLAGSDPNNLSLTMERGSASIEGASGDAQRVRANQRASLGADSVSVSEVAIQLLEPGNQQIVPLAGAALAVNFRWQLREAVFDGLTFEVSRTRDFARPFTSRPAAAGRATVSLGEGGYYWRVRGKNRKTGRAESSEIAKITLVPATALKLFAPAPGARVGFVERPPLVSFSWTRHPLARSYLLEIARDARFKNGLQRLAVSANSYGVDDLAAGTYFWRVRTVSSLEGVPPVTSGVQSFSVVKTDAFETPAAIRPESENVSRALAEKGVLFSWQASPELESYVLEISRDPGFRQIIETRETSSNYARVEGLSEDGNYYWRVKGRSRGGRETAYSPATRFAVTEKGGGALAALSEEEEAEYAEGIGGDEWRRRRAAKRAEQATEAGDAANAEKAGESAAERAEREKREQRDGFAALAPVGVTINVATQRSIEFRWKAARGARGYAFRLYRGAAGARKLVLEKTLTGTSYTLTDFRVLDEGPFTWTVAVRGSEAADRTIESRFLVTADDRLKNLRPEDIEFISPETIYKEGR